CGHVEHAADGCSATFDATSPTVATAIVVERCDTHEGSNGLAIESTQFGHFGHERGTGHLGDTRSRREQLNFSAPIVVGLEESSNFCFELINFLRQYFQD